LRNRTHHAVNWTIEDDSHGRSKGADDRHASARIGGDSQLDSDGTFIYENRELDVWQWVDLVEEDEIDLMRVIRSELHCEHDFDICLENGFRLPEVYESCHGERFLAKKPTDRQGDTDVVLAGGLATGSVLSNTQTILAETETLEANKLLCDDHSRKDDQDLTIEQPSENSYASKVNPKPLKKITIMFHNRMMSHSLANPTVSTIRGTISKKWKLPDECYYFTINGQHESHIENWPNISTIRIHGKIKGGAKPPMGMVTLHFKSTNDAEVYEIKLRDNIQLEDVASMVEDVFDVLSDVKLYQGGSELSPSDALRDLPSATGGKSQITLKPELSFSSDDKIQPLPSMEVWHDETSRWFSRMQDWKSRIVEYFELENLQWHLDKASQEWEEGCFELKIDPQATKPESDPFAQEEELDSMLIYSQWASVTFSRSDSLSPEDMTEYLK
jgi:hypothetical protein